jgi:hypothetical protein
LPCRFAAERYPDKAADFPQRVARAFPDAVSGESLSDRRKGGPTMAGTHTVPRVTTGNRLSDRARSTGNQAARFGLHFLEMCIPMCLGFMVGDAIYFLIADAAGYSKPFTELPVLSVVVVTFNITAPMVWWMRFRGMARRMVAEMAGSMIVLAAGLLVAGLVGLVPKGDMALAVHGLMMPAMLIPMLLHLDLYTGRATPSSQQAQAQ